MRYGTRDDDSVEITEWLFEVVLALLTLIALVCARGHSVEHANLNAPLALVNPDA
jgi:hypothetical protein